MDTSSLLARLGIDDRDRWRELWQRRLAAMGGGASDAAGRLDPRLLWGLALPMLSWLERAPAAPVLALQAPVGAGKTTLSRALQQLAALIGCRLAVVSIDDAYLGWQERQQRMAGNPFGVNRVPPGSHDVDLLLQAMAAWRAHSGPERELRLPRFDKTLRRGQGDRAGFVTTAADALLLEGWLVGYEPLGEPTIRRWLAVAGHDLSPPEQQWLLTCDQSLAAYSRLWAACDSFWCLEPSDWSAVLRWRLQAEARQRRTGSGAMDATLVKRLVRATMASLPPALYQSGLQQRAMAVAQLDRRRRCIGVEPSL